MKIVVLAGGLSTERAVSLVTGSSVCRALRENGHRAILVDVFLGLEEVPAELETLFEQNDVYFALENNELFLSVRSQSLGEAFEDDVFGSVYNLIYRVAYTHNAQGELIFIQ
jgi:D-alanine-D-alanine ligase-like ATP-grasp enzyme